MRLLDLPVELVALLAPHFGLQTLGRWTSTAKGLPCADVDWIAAVIGRFKQSMPLTLPDKQWAALFGLSLQTQRREIIDMVECLQKWEMCSVQQFRDVLQSIASDNTHNIVLMLRSTPRLLVQTHFDPLAPTYTNHFALLEQVPHRDTRILAAVIERPRRFEMNLPQRDGSLKLGAYRVRTVALVDMIFAAPPRTAMYQRFVQRANGRA
jgi:hypothetical protein